MEERITNSPCRIKPTMIPSPTEMQAPERIVLAFNGRGLRCLVLCDVEWNVGGEWVRGGGSEE